MAASLNDLNCNNVQPPLFLSFYVSCVYIFSFFETFMYSPILDSVQVKKTITKTRQEFAINADDIFVKSFVCHCKKYKLRY